MKINNKGEFALVESNNPMPIKAIPYQHQIKAYDFVCDKFGLISGNAASTGTALLMEMGTGKTITTISVIGALYNAGKIKRALIIAPLSIVGVWLEELQKFADFNYTVAVLSGTGNKKVDTLRHMTGTPLQIG